MRVLPSPADFEQGADGLVEMERELTRLLIEYDELETAWPKCRHVLIRAKAGRPGRRRASPDSQLAERHRHDAGKDAARSGGAAAAAAYTFTDDFVLGIDVTSASESLPSVPCHSLFILIFRPRGALGFAILPRPYHSSPLSTPHPLSDSEKDLPKYAT